MAFTQVRKSSLLFHQSILRVVRSIVFLFDRSVLLGSSAADLSSSFLRVLVQQSAILSSTH